MRTALAMSVATLLPPSLEKMLVSATPGLTRQAQQHHAVGHQVTGDTVTDYRRQFDAHIGSPETVLNSLKADGILARATDISFQVHSVEPSHRDTLRSIELIAEHIAPHIV